MAGTLYQLGEFQFNLANGSPETLERDLNWRWPVQDRLQRKPALQFVGPSADRVILDGVLYPGSTGRQNTIDTLREMADTGEPQTLVDGLGRVYGRFAIINIGEKRGVFIDTGAARKIEFTITLMEYGEDGTNKADPSAVYQSNPSFLSNVLRNVDRVAFAGSGSPIEITDWTNLPDFGADLSTLANAGFSIPQTAVISQAVGGAENVAPALKPFGAWGSLTESQESAWSAIGIDPLALLGSMQSGTGPYSTAISLDKLRTAGGSLIEQLAGPALSQVQGMIGSASTLSPLLNIDPQISSMLSPSLLLP